MTSAIDHSAVKVYTVNGAASGSSSSLPDWLTRKRAAKGKGKRAARETIEGTIELIQHFEFPEASNRIKTTRDGHHAIATGTYKPQIKVWDLDQLSLKFERHSDAENVDFLILSDDWTKTLHLQNDRTLELHTQGGFHYRTRIPRFGRSLAYHFPSCDALVGATGNEVYRLNLEQGRFLNPLVLQGDDHEDVPGVNVVDINPAHQLLAFGVEARGVVQFWDSRSRSRVGLLRLPKNRLMTSASSVAQSLPGVDEPGALPGLSITSIASRADGLTYAIGTSSGHTLLYDIRSDRPFATKDQGYGLPVKNLSWINGGSRMAGDSMIMSADKKVIKIWDRNSPSTNFASITPATDLNDLHHVPASGLIMCANEGIQMSSYYIPQLGPAPRWCSFLDNITEEMEDQTTRNVYEDYKFIERSELASLGLDHLVGTPALKPYMHGYFVSLKLYDTARVIANPFAYAEHREKLIREKMEKAAESRIRAPKNGVPGVKVNKALAERVKREEERERRRLEKKAERKRTAVTVGEGTEESGTMDVDETAEPKNTGLLNDSRFTALFEDPQFQVDETSREFALMNPSAVALRPGRETGNTRAKTAVEDEEEESDKMSSDGLGGSIESESENASDDSSDAGDLQKTKPQRQAEHNDRQVHNSKAASLPRGRGSEIRMVPMRAQIRSNRGSRAGDKHATFGQRRTSDNRPTRKSQTEFVSRSADGGFEMSWVPTAASSKRHAEEDARADRLGAKGKKNADKSREKRRGVETFGAGMEKGGEEPAASMRAGDRKGRTERRRGIRSGSKNAIFGRT